MGYTLYVDASDLNEKIEIMRLALSEEGFNRLMLRTFNEVGKKARTLIYRGVKEDYVVKRDWVYSAIKSAKISVGGDGVQCVIPLSGAKGSIGGDFSATGGARGWKIRRKYKVKSKIVTAGTSTMPMAMTSYGDGEPPFRNLSWNTIAFTRTGKDRLPIKKIVGLALPQMPLNRSEDAVADGLLEYAGERLDHNFGRIFAGH